ncbi:MAG: MBL fold metallo-hydrolase [Roseivirga sp.]|nr:MBL fold metallo-hydrolase [Roseivirga sp.]
MKYFLTSLLSIFCVSAFSQSLSITYIANEGVLIESAGKKVIIDALFDKYYDAYLFPDEALLEKMISGKAPYNDVDLMLSTHIHRDHFAPTMTGRFLKGHPETKLISSTQLTQSISKDYAEGKSVAKQLEGITRDEDIHQHEINGLKVSSFFIYHSGGSRTRSIENMGYLVEINGTKILHLGDSDMNPDRFKELDLKSLGVDIAMVPYWYMADEAGTQIIREYIVPKHLIGIHYPKVGSPMALKEIAKNFPEARVFKEVFEKAEY